VRCRTLCQSGPIEYQTERNSCRRWPTTSGGHPQCCAGPGMGRSAGCETLKANGGEERLGGCGEDGNCGKGVLFRLGLDCRNSPRWWRGQYQAQRLTLTRDLPMGTHPHSQLRSPHGPAQWLYCIPSSRKRTEKRSAAMTRCTFDRFFRTLTSTHWFWRILLRTAPIVSRHSHGHLSAFVVRTPDPTGEPDV